VVPFEQVGINAIAAVGGKNASLGEMIRELAGQGVRVPDGFATTADAYRQLIEPTAWPRLHGPCWDSWMSTTGRPAAAGAEARSPAAGRRAARTLQQAIVAAYRHGRSLGPGGPAVAVRSSATAEDLPDASFAGQQETYLNMRGGGGAAGGLPPLLRLPVHRPGHLLPPAQRLRSPRGGPLDRRAAHGARRPGSAGVMFTIDTETGFRDAVLLTAAYGLGENVVQGR
jgi:pyruvate, water dikinase